MEQINDGVLDAAKSSIPVVPAENAKETEGSAALSAPRSVVQVQSENHTRGVEMSKMREETYTGCGCDDNTVLKCDENTVVKCDDNTAKRKRRGPDREKRRLKGTGGLQQERTGMWTIRCVINGKRIAKSTGTKDREEAERYLKKFLAPYVKGDAELTYAKIQAAVATEHQLEEMREDERPQMKLTEVWDAYDRSLRRRDLAPTTLAGKKQVWRIFLEFMNATFPEVTELRRVRREHAEAYLNTLRDGHSSLTYNQRLCVLREMHRVLMEDARAKENPWADFRLRPDDSHTRRELTVEELSRLIDMASRLGFEWRCLFAIGMYTGMRLGDCCKLTWGEVDIVRSVIQKIPEKTKKYRKGRPVTIPIHKVLSDLLVQTPIEKRTGYVLPVIGEWAADGARGMGKIQHRLGKIFHNAGIVTSVTVEGRRWKAPETGFHSLRHTFVSLSANAGVPLHIVQSIVGHESNAMTRHYFHENIGALQQAVEAIPSISETGEVREGEVAQPDAGRMYNRIPQPVPKAQLPPPPPVPEVVDIPSDDAGRESTGAEAPLEGRQAERNAVRRRDKLATVESANHAVANMSGWGLEEAKASALPTVNRRQRQEWISRSVRKWCLRNKIAILEGTTMLIGNGGYRFLQQIWDGPSPMTPDDAIDAMEVFLRAQGVR